MANEKRLIDANALLDVVDISKFLNPHGALSVRINHRHERDHFTKMIYDAPTVDAVEVVHGRWEIVEPKRYPDLTARIRCSACKKEPKKHSYEERGHGYGFTVNSWDATDYCPNCGAKMDAAAAERPEV